VKSVALWVCILLGTKNVKAKIHCFSAAAKFATGLLATLAIGLLAQTAQTAQASGNVVVTDKGVVKGTVGAEGRQFLGIPYAAPPIGERRWRAPAAAARWSGFRDATSFGNNCPQFGTPFGLQSFDEDCLFLNVFTPPQPDRHRLRRDPVMVWFHPGAFQFGESDDYDPRRLVERGVVVVTVNYRLGALGFLAHPDLSAESSEGTSGNYAIQDQQAALRWVKRNIGAFGGDLDNVTIFGESAGGLSVHTHLASPKSRGLFDRAIVQSGSYSLTQPTLAAVEAEGLAFAAAVSCSAHNLACLRAVPVANVLAKQRPGALGFLPNVDGVVLPMNIGQAFASGRFNRVPVLAGTTHDEFRLFVPLFFDFIAGPVTADFYPTAVGILLGVPAAAVPSVVAQYPLANYSSPAVALGALATDAIFACNMQTATQRLSQYVPTWVYEFNDPTAPQRYLPPASFPYGAYHEAEIQYLFDIVTTMPGVALDQSQLRLARSMTHYWTNFAHFANPNDFVTPLWLRQTARVDFVQSLQSPRPQFYSSAAFRQDHKCDFWNAFFGN
jgi:para-nitrobenzyl esterase